MRRRQGCGSFVCLALALCSGLGLASEPKVNGRLEAYGEIAALRVWGSPTEMGFAHGYLLAPQIVSGLGFDYAGLAAEQRGARDAGRRSIAAMVRLSARLSEELEGFLAGVRAKLGANAGEKLLGRPLDLDDLKFWTAFDAVRAFGCSGFTVWGDRAGEAGVITTRNFDFELLGDDMLDRQVLLIREPTGRKRTAMVTLAGYLGAYTGLNEDGVCAFIHDGSGPISGDGFTSIKPLIPALTEHLETSSPKDAQSGVESMLKGRGKYPFSYMVRVVTPRVGNTAAERVFHIDASGVGENIAGSGVCITTNHYVDVGGKADATADRWSVSRYERLEKPVKATVTSKGAWDALNAVAAEEGRAGTLHSLVVLPEARTLEVAFATIENGRLVSATKRARVAISFDELFYRPHD